MEELGKSGLSAVPVISGMLDDPVFADEASEVVDVLVDAGGDTVGRELNQRLSQELEFWESKGPALQRGWWNSDASIHAPLRERYSLTYALIVGLEKTRYTAALGAAAELRVFWRSLPQLNDPTGLDKLIDECDKLIGMLRTEKINAVVRPGGQ